MQVRENVTARFIPAQAACNVALSATYCLIVTADYASSFLASAIIFSAILAGTSS